MRVFLQENYDFLAERKLQERTFPGATAPIDGAATDLILAVDVVP